MAALLWSAFILLLCGLPGSDFPDMSPWRLLSFDKFVHCFMFLVLVLISIGSLKKQISYKIVKYNAIKIALAWAIFLGIASEVLQGLVFAERSADIYDAIANTIGALLGFVAFYLIYGRENTLRFG
jgi:VanZ family protein